MKTLFVTMLVIHGLIHLFGLIKTQSYSATPAFDRTAMIWIIICTMFLLTAFGYFSGKSLWWLLAIVSVTLSQVLVIAYWKEAKWGTAANIIVVFVAIVSFAGWNFNRKINAEAKALLALSVTEKKILTSDMLNGLPQPVQLWLHHSGVVGKAMTNTVRLKQTGVMRTSPGQKNWIKTNAEQYFTINQPAFIWKVKMNMMSFIPVSGKDEWIDGRGRMNIKVFSLYNVVNQEGNKIDEGALQRWLAEIVWFPSAALSSFIKWEAVDSLSAKATLSYKGISGSVVFQFSEQGDVLSCSAMRYMGGGKQGGLEQWEVQSKEFAIIHNIRIPVKSEATWKLRSGNFTWYKLEVTDIDYDSPFVYN